MSHQPEVEDSPTIFVPLNTPALYRVDQLKGFLQSLESRAFRTTCCRLNCSTFRNMKSQLQEHVIGIPVSCQYDKPSLSNGSGKWDSTNYRINKNGKKADNFVDGVREHESFQANFGVGEGEKLLKASQCYLSTTGGPIAGLLFISSQRIAFCSDRSTKFSSPNGELIRIHYKKDTKSQPKRECENSSQKYMEIITVDNFDFWFMGFLNYQRAFSYLQQALCEAQNLVEK
ncbi:hypothetical protein AAG906_022019 [Vitis piasezkii]